MIQVQPRFQSFEDYLSYRDRDYVANRIQYQDCGIPEYWIVDPEAKSVLVLALTDNTYTEVGSFSGNEKVQSPQFRELTLTAAQILEAGH
jgi:Uma2 family endonuclease